METQTWSTTRQFNNTLDAVFRAFTESEAVGRWMCGTTYDTLAIDLDPRPGGVLHHRVRAKRDSVEWTFFGVYLEVEPQIKLRYTFEWKTDWRDAPSPSEVEILFRRLEETTEIQIVHSALPEAAVPSTETHWVEFLEVLQAMMEAERSA